MGCFGESADFFLGVFLLIMKVWGFWPEVGRGGVQFAVMEKGQYSFKGRKRNKFLHTLSLENRIINSSR